MASRKLTKDEVIEIWHRGHNGESIAHICKEFDVSDVSAYRIVNGGTYRDITSKIEPREHMKKSDQTKIKILFAIGRYIEEHWESPTQAELAKVVGVREPHICHHISEMVDAGVLYHDPRTRSRSIRIHKPNGFDR